MGGAALSLVYVVDTDSDGSAGNRFDNATGTAMSAQITTTVGAVGVTAAYASHSNTSVDDTETGVALSYSSSMGDVVVGYGSSTGTVGGGNVLSASYTMALDADTSLAVGYASYDADSATGTETNVSISRALGGGASVFVDCFSSRFNNCFFCTFIFCNICSSYWYELNVLIYLKKPQTRGLAPLVLFSTILISF